MSDGSNASENASTSGRVVLVSSPIGNLDDISPRAVAALERADVVACEDTRHSGRLLAHLGLRKKLISLHEHNERRRVPSLLDRLAEGNEVAVLSDAGTPLLSDPGFVLVREAADRGFAITAIPGPSAILAALVVSAMPPYPFTFLGFPPPKSGRRRRFFERFGALDHTVVFFESPHRVVASLADAVAVLGERPAALCRELTKLHEEVVRGTLGSVRDALVDRPSIKGELVVVVGPMLG